MIHPGNTNKNCRCKTNASEMYSPDLEIPVQKRKHPNGCSERKCLVWTVVWTLCERSSFPVAEIKYEINKI